MTGSYIIQIMRIPAEVSRGNAWTSLCKYNASFNIYDIQTSSRRPGVNKSTLEDFENIENPITFCNRHTCPRNSAWSLGDLLYISEQQSKYSVVYRDFLL